MTEEENPKNLESKPKKDRPKFLDYLENKKAPWILVVSILVITLIFLLIFIPLSEADKRDAKKIQRYDDGCPVETGNYQGLDYLKCSPRSYQTSTEPIYNNGDGDTYYQNQDSTKEVFKRLNQDYPNAKYYYVGIYESVHSSDNVYLNISQDENQDIILVLVSNKDVNWSILDKNEVVKSVVYDSNQGSSLVVYNSNFNTQEIPNLYSQINSYEFNQNFAQSAGLLLSEYGVELQGFTGKYTADSLIVPQHKFNSFNLDSKIAETKTHQTDQKKPMDMDDSDCIKTSSGDMICGGEGEDLIIV